MATYNGAKYLDEQLQSFLGQTRLPDELVVTDDGSSDDTLRILESFAKRAPFDVRIIVNKERLGYGANFGKALSLTTGDLIFLSDQDDIWFDDKIKIMAEYANSNQEILLFLNDAEMCNADGRPSGFTAYRQTLSLGLGDSAFTTGCCMAVRRQLLAVALPVPVPEFVHDTWLNRLSLALKRRAVVPLVLQYYRRHDSNTSDWIASKAKRLGLKDLFELYWDKDQRLALVENCKKLEELRHRLSACVTDGAFEPALTASIADGLLAVGKESDAIDDRLKLLSYPRVVRWFPALVFFLRGGYFYFSGWKSLVKDIVMR